jgi:hypothetical protein
MRISLAFMLHGREQYASLHASITDGLEEIERAVLATLLEEHGALVQGCAELLNEIVASNSPVGRRALLSSLGKDIRCRTALMRGCAQRASVRMPSLRLGC